MHERPSLNDVNNNLQSRSYLEWLRESASDDGDLEADYKKVAEKLKSINEQAERMILQEDWWMEEDDPGLITIAGIPIVVNDLLPEGGAYMVDTSQISLGGSDSKRPILMMPKGAVMKVKHLVNPEDAWWMDENDPGIS